MIENLRQILILARVDEVLRAREAEAAGIPVRRAELEARVEAAARALAEARAAVEAHRHEERRIEGEVRDREALIQRLETQTYQVKSNEAYRAMLHEMEHARTEISERETAILELMEALDRAHAALAEAEVAVAAAARAAKDEEQAIAAREAELVQEVARARGERDGVAKGIAAAVLSQYERIASRRRPAVVVASHDLCLGCRVNIPPQHSLRLLRGDSIVTCGACQRILVHERVAADVAALGPA